MWSAETGHCSKILAGHDDDVKSAALFTDESMVASSGPSKKDVGPHHWGLRVLIGSGARPGDGRGSRGVSVLVPWLGWKRADMET